MLEPTTVSSHLLWHVTWFHIGTLSARKTIVIYSKKAPSVQMKIVSNPHMQVNLSIPLLQGLMCEVICLPSRPLPRLVYQICWGGGVWLAEWTGRVFNTSLLERVSPMVLKQAICFLLRKSILHLSPYWGIIDQSPTSVSGQGDWADYGISALEGFGLNRLSEYFSFRLQVRIWNWNCYGYSDGNSCHVHMPSKTWGKECYLGASICFFAIISIPTSDIRDSIKMWKNRMVSGNKCWVRQQRATNVKWDKPQSIFSYLESLMTFIISWI